MQLGARWRTGEAPHRAVPAGLHAAIAEAEAAAPHATAWTLTWLEGRPVCTLDTGLALSLGSGGEIVHTPRVHDASVDDAADDWLS